MLGVAVRGFGLEVLGFKLWDLGSKSLNAQLPSTTRQTSPTPNEPLTRTQALKTVSLRTNATSTELRLEGKFEEGGS